MTGIFQIGDKPEWTFVPVPADPESVEVSTAVEFTTIHPDGSATVYTDADSEVTGDGTDGWTLTLPTLTVDDIGVWELYARSTAGVMVGEESAWLVRSRTTFPVRALDRWPVAWLPSFNPTNHPPVLISLARDAAEGILWALSGRQFGVWTVTHSFRPSMASGGCYTPYKGVDSLWRNGGTSLLPLRLSGPVRAVLWVEANGTVLDPSAYRLERNRLWRADGAAWPTVTVAEAPPIRVRYSYGLDVPAGAQLAMGEVSQEFLRGFTTGECKLPSNVLNIARQGVTVQLGDPTAVFADRRVGLPIADQWLKSVNPKGLTGGPVIVSPDQIARVR